MVLKNVETIDLKIVVNQKDFNILKSIQYFLAIHFMPESVPFIACLEGGLRSKIKFEKIVRKCYSKFHTSPHIYDQIM